MVSALKDHIVLGVDGGGTRLRVALATAAGNILATGESGPGNYHDVGIDNVKSHVRQALSNAWASASLGPRQVHAAFFGLASVASAEDRATIRGMTRELRLAPDERIGIDHDLRIAMAGALVGQPGIVLIVGTGSSCYGRSTAGKTWRAGGWGPVLDDVGSGGWLGLQGMIAAVRDFDGRGTPTILRTTVLETLQLNDIQQILHRIDAEGLTRKQTASLSRLVLDAANKNDTVARQIIARGAGELSQMVAAVEKKLDLVNDLNPVPVAVTGGLMDAGPVLTDPLRSAIEDRVPGCTVVRPEFSPLLGGVLLAIDKLGLPITPIVVDNLQKGQAGLVC